MVIWHALALRNGNMAHTVFTRKQIWFLLLIFTSIWRKQFSIYSCRRGKDSEVKYQTYTHESTAQKMKFSNKDLVAFTEEIVNWKIFCAVKCIGRIYHIPPPFPKKLYFGYLVLKFFGSFFSDNAWYCWHLDKLVFTFYICRFSVGYRCAFCDKFVSPV